MLTWRNHPFSTYRSEIKSRPDLCWPLCFVLFPGIYTQIFPAWDKIWSEARMAMEKTGTHKEMNRPVWPNFAEFRATGNTLASMYTKSVTVLNYPNITNQKLDYLDFNSDRHVIQDCRFNVCEIASFPSHSQILPCSCGEKWGQNLEGFQVMPACSNWNSLVSTKQRP